MREHSGSVALCPLVYMQTLKLHLLVNTHTTSAAARSCYPILSSHIHPLILQVELYCFGIVVDAERERQRDDD